MLGIERAVNMFDAVPLSEQFLFGERFNINGDTAVQCSKEPEVLCVISVIVKPSTEIGHLSGKLWSYVFQELSGHGGVAIV